MQLVDSETGVTEPSELSRRYDITIMQSNSLITAILKEWKEYFNDNVNTIVAYLQTKYGKLRVQKKCTLQIYKNINSKDNIFLLDIPNC